MIHLFIKSEICDYIDPIDTDVDPDIKRNIITDVIDVPVKLTMKPGSGNIMGVESIGGKLSGNSYSTGLEVIGTLNPVLRMSDGSENDLGTLLALKNKGALPTMGMSSDARDYAVNLMIATLQVQQWLEAEGVLGKNPDQDLEMYILVDVADGKATYKVLKDNETVELVTQPVRGAVTSSVKTVKVRGGNQSKNDSGERAKRNSDTKKEESRNRRSTSETDRAKNDREEVQKKYDDDMRIYRTRLKELEQEKEQKTADQYNEVARQAETEKEIATNTFEQEKKKNSADQKAIRSEMAEAEKTLSTLKFYQFGEKKRIREHIEKLQAKISVLERDWMQAKERYRKKLEDIEKDVQEKERRINVSVWREFKQKEPNRPVKPRILMSKRELEMEPIKNEVLSMIYKLDRPVTVSDLVEHSGGRLSREQVIRAKNALEHDELIEYSYITKKQCMWVTDEGMRYLRSL